MAYVQLKAGHSQSQITERYIHAAQVLFAGAAERAVMLSTWLENVSGNWRSII